MGWELHQAKSAFPSYAAEWDRLNTRLCHGHPFFDSRFIGALLDHFANGSEILCLHHERNELNGALILQPGKLGRWVSFRPSQAQITALLIDNALLLDSLLNVLPGLTWGIELIAIDPRFVPPFSLSTLTFITFPQACTIGVGAQIQFDDYWNKRSKNLKANIRRYLNRLEKEFGASVLTRLSDASEMVGGVKRFGEIESTGWKGAAGTAISPDNAQGAFYSDVLRRFATTNQANIFELRVSGHLTASRLLITNEKMAVILKTTYDETYSRIAPGRIQLRQLIEDQLTHRPHQTIEFYTNATRDQKEWATFDCSIQNIQIFKNDCLANAFVALKAFRGLLLGNETGKNPLSEIEIGATDSIESLAASGITQKNFKLDDHFELSPDWFDLLQKTVYPGNSGVRFYYAKEGNRITLLPLRLIRRGRCKSIDSLANFYTALYAPLQPPDCDGLALRLIFAAAIRDQGGTHVMRFAPMDCESQAYSQIQNELRAIGWIPFRFYCFGNWFLEVKDNWENYLRKRSANLRSAIKRRSRDFLAAGGSLDVITEANEIEQAICDFQEVYSASWKVPEPYPDFIPALIRWLSEKGMLRLGFARLNEKPIASQIWIVTPGKASIFKVAYHEAYAGYSPGTVLTSYLLQHVIEKDRVNEVDYLIGDDKYKKLWMSNRRERWGIVAYNPSTLIGMALLIREIAGRIIKIARRRSKEMFSNTRN